MTALSLAVFEFLAGIIESVLRRVEVPIEATERALSAGMESALSAAVGLPAAIVIAVVGLLVWGGRRFVRAVVVVIALQLVLLSGLWTSGAVTVLLGIVAGTIGGILAFGFAYAVLSVRRRLQGVMQVGASIRVSVIVVLVIAATALFSSAVQPAWTLSTILLAAGLAVPGFSLERWELAPQRLRIGALEQGIAAALLIGTVSGSGLGGLAVRAVTTSDTVLSLQVLLAMTGLSVALFAIAARDVEAIEEAGDLDPGFSPGGHDLTGERQ